MKKIKNDIYRDSSKIVDRIEDILLIFEDENPVKVLNVSPWILKDKNKKPRNKGIMVEINVIEEKETNWEERKKTHSNIKKALCDRLYKFSYKYYEETSWGSIIRIRFTKRIL